MLSADADEVPFPYAPYAMQKDVMQFIRQSIAACRVAVVESPTGTGKSQMLLNGVLSGVFSSHASSLTAPPTPSTRSTSGYSREADKQGSLMNHDRRRERTSGSRRRQRGRRTSKDLLAGGDSDLIHQSDAAAHRSYSSSSSSSSSTSSVDDGTPLAPTFPKVIFSSRTHSQLAQLGEELRKTVFRHPPIPSSLHDRSSHSLLWRPLPFIHLASRSQLCINRLVRTAVPDTNGSTASLNLNERCKDALDRTYTKEGRRVVKEFWRRRQDRVHNATMTSVSVRPHSSSHGAGRLMDLEDLAAISSGCGAGTGSTAAPLPCPFADKAKVRLLMEHCRASSKTADELRVLGESIGACPFLATKMLVAETPVIFTPYAYLVDPVSRQQLLPGLFDGEDCVSGCQVTGASDGTTDAPAAAPISNLVVVFDEAHHVADAARRVSSATLRYSHIALVKQALAAYATKYELRLLAVNKQKIRELLFFCEQLQHYCGHVTARRSTAPPRLPPTGFSRMETADQTESVFHAEMLADFLFHAQIDHMNLRGIAQFIEDSRLAFKLGSQWEAVCCPIDAASSSGQQARLCLTQAAFSLLAVLHALASNEDSFETVVCWREQQPLPAGPLHGGVTADVHMDVQCITGRGAMAAIWEHCRSVVLAGGTMQPTKLLVDTLLPLSREPRCADIRTFPHVIPADQLRVLTLGSGPDRHVLEFTFANRNAGGQQPAATHESLAWTLINLCRVIPDGVVVCFTSYANEQAFVDHLDSSPSSLRAALTSQKKLFRECDYSRRSGSSEGVQQSQGGSASVDALLAEFKRWIEQCRKERLSKASVGGCDDATPMGAGKGGAVLFCVMGGSLSEGINFSDHLARAVIVVGVPYPRPNDLLTRLTMVSAGGESANVSDVGSRLRHEVLQFFDSASGSTSGKQPQARTANSALLHATAMRAVNQSAGRCIRHIRDYAVVVLIDARYGRPLPSHGGRSLAEAYLSSWMVPSLTRCDAFTDCFRAVREFFANRTESLAA